MKKTNRSAGRSIQDFLKGSETKMLFDHLISAFNECGAVELHPAKTMIGIATRRKRIAWITHIGKNFVHVVFPFDKAYPDNLCFQKIAQVPGDSKQFNHHFRMYSIDDVNEEVKSFLKLAFELGS